MTTRLRALITDLAHDAGIDVIQVEGRAKTVDSFAEKIGRKGKKYENPFTDMTDLIGLRIIIYYREDVARIGEILKGELKVDEKNSVDKITGLAADRFGYRSVHYIVWPSPAGGSSPSCATPAPGSRRSTRPTCAGATSTSRWTRHRSPRTWTTAGKATSSAK